MLSSTRQEEIFKKAKELNSISDEYQLIHATFALEKVFNQALKDSYEESFAELRAEIIRETDPEKLTQLSEKFKDLRENRLQKKAKISIVYLDEIKGESARTIRSQNAYTIILPGELKRVRNEDGSFNIKELGLLRRLMAHELGHIVLHSDKIVNENPMGTAAFDVMQEEEADYFAEQLIHMRRERNDELYKDKNYVNI